mmetsp:Transcript_36982/g.95879  ORF Transcript_36982/g.95879 Transcript_36982/m.95879 type:complete len:237 (-) Transcript_36982:36-746(-)
MARDRVLVILTIVICFLSFGNGAVFIVIVLVTTTPLSSGGLGMSEQDLGIVFVTFGIGACIFQLTSYRKMVTKFGMYTTFYIGSTSMAVALFLMYFASPVSVALPIQVNESSVPQMLSAASNQAKVYAWVMIMLATAFLCVAFMVVQPVVRALLSNAADKYHQGLAQGASISLSALLRALGPFVVSAVFSASYRILEFPLLIYISLALLYFVSSFLVIFVARVRFQNPVGAANMTN